MPVDREACPLRLTHTHSHREGRPDLTGVSHKVSHANSEIPHRILQALMPRLCRLMLSRRDLLYGSDVALLYELLARLEVTTVVMPVDKQTVV